LRIHGDEVRAEEATQEAFVRAWQRVAGFEGRSAFSTWLHRLAVNVCLDGIRSKSREAIFESFEEGSSDAHPGRSSEVEPETALDLERAIRQLPKGARTAFVLHDIEGYRHREIAEMTGLAEGTWKAQLHRARRLLRKRLER
jgi:RNA polymerase sigma-70 factor (ECF subfamily)